MKNGSELKIGHRITYAWHEDALTVIINQRITSSQQMMLDAWFTAWLLVGGALGYAYTQSQGEEQNFLLICLAFWTFFAIRVLKVLAWRRVGKEMIRVNAEGMSIKNAFGNYGKAKFFIKSISNAWKFCAETPPNSCTIWTKVFGSWAVTPFNSTTCAPVSYWANSSMSETPKHLLNYLTRR